MEKRILMAMAPVFLGLIALEAWYWRRRNPSMYSLRDSLSFAWLALMHQASDAVSWLAVIGRADPSASAWYVRESSVHSPS